MGRPCCRAAGVIQLSWPVLQVTGQPVQRMLHAPSRPAPAFGHHPGYAARVNAVRLRSDPSPSGFRVPRSQGRRPAVQVFQQMIAVQQAALLGEDRRHLLGNPGCAISHAMHPGVVPIAAPQGQGKHLLSRPLGRTDSCSVPALPSSRRLHQAQPHFPPLGLPGPLGTPPH